MTDSSHGLHESNTCSSGSFDQEVLTLGGKGRLFEVRVQGLGPNAQA